MRKVIIYVLCIMLAVTGVYCCSLRQQRAREIEAVTAQILREHEIEEFRLLSVRPVKIRCGAFEGLSDADKLRLINEINGALGCEMEIYTDEISCYYIVSRERLRSGGIYSRAGLYFRCDSAIWFIC